ncbi:MAG: ATP-binding cassette domain-containing protein [Bacteroidales bacterium]|jgi:ABC-2 type transport system ATP-binding protein|nr:ATP-binding cassette domain-containing protein [Bacteroidales bacterium]MDN5348966.1 type transport system ATP-binding protein [Bacteroidales bacterium]
MTSETVLSIHGLVKQFGRVKAVDSLQLEIASGQIFGILGPNGSGKTTTLGMVLGLIRPDRGSFEWFGKPLSPDVLKQIGSILETPLFYPYLSATDNLKIIADIKQTKYNELPELLKMVGLFERRKDAFKTYSLGMKQRLAIAAAMLGDPEVLILDEPTNGLDPQGIAEIRELILQIGRRGKTIIMASHLLDEVQKICTDVAVLQKGVCLYSGSVSAIMSDGVSLEISAEDTKQLLSVIEACEWIALLGQKGDVIKVNLDKNNSPADLNIYLVQQGVRINHLSASKKSLETHFLEILKQQA